MTRAGLDYLNGPGAGELDAAACGAVLRSLGEIEATFTTAHAAVLARFDAADAHDSDGYGTSAAWLMAMTDMTRPDARAKVRRMRLLRGHREMADALVSADISKSQALAIAEWTRKLPAELRAETIKILVQAAAAGASLDDLRIIAGVALQKWRASRPDADEDGFDDRYVQAATTFGSAEGVIRGNLTPECAAAVQAVLEALGKKAGAEDVRTEGQRFHDALLQGCELLIGAKMRCGTGPARTPVSRCTSRSRGCGSIPKPQRRRRCGCAARRASRDSDREERRGGRLQRGRRTGGHRARGHAGGGQDHRAGARRGRHHPRRRPRPGRRWRGRRPGQHRLGRQRL